MPSAPPRMPDTRSPARRILSHRAVTWRRLVPRSLLILLGCMVAGACGGDDSGWGRALGGGGGRQRLGVALPSRTDPFFQAVEAGIRDAARRARYEIIVTDAAYSAATQVTQIADLLQRDVDALVIAPVDTLAIVPAVERANAARIPVFTVGLRPSGGRIVSHVQSDHAGMGRIAAEYLAAFLDGRGEAVVVSRPGVPWLAERERGFRDAMRAHRGIRIIDSVQSVGSRERSATDLQTLLRAQRATDAIFSVDDPGALGAYDAALDRYRTDLFIVGADASAEAVRLIQSDGPFKASVVQQPRRIGAQIVQLAVRHFDDEPVAPRVLVPVRLVNIDTLRPARETAAARR